MPDNTSPYPHLVLVRNRAGVSIPFSADALATSLLVAGLNPQQAYELASAIEQSLQVRPEIEVSSRELSERVATLLETRIGVAESERYLSWRRFRQSGRPLVLCLHGTPGVGKSTMATNLAPRFGVRRVVATDALREVLRMVVPRSAAPDLHRAAHEAVSGGENPSSAGFLRQAHAVGDAAIAVAERTVGEGRNLILVGSHLIPGELGRALAQRGNDALVLELLLTLESESLHRSVMMRHTRSDPAHPDVRHIQNFSGVRLLQTELQRLARESGVPWFDATSQTSLTEWIVDHVVASGSSKTKVQAEAI